MYDRRLYPNDIDRLKLKIAVANKTGADTMIKTRDLEELLQGYNPQSQVDEDKRQLKELSNQCQASRQEIDLLERKVARLEHTLRLNKSANETSKQLL